MKKNLGLLAVLAVVIVVVAVSGCSNNNNTTNNTTNNTINDKSTKVAIFNNGTTWAHVEMDTNVTNKNGTNMSIGSDTFVKPNSNVTIDLSYLMGYGNEPLPAGTVIRIQSWKGLFNTTGGGEGALNISFQGWSNNRYPSANDNITNVTYNPLTINTLPANITNSIAYIATTPEEFAKYQSIDTSSEEILYEEEIITVNADGSVTITISRVPELCRAIASIL